MHRVNIREATRDDTAAIHDLVRQHAAYERESFTPSGPAAQPDVEQLAEYLFGDQPRVGCLVAEDGGQVVGYTSFVLQEATWRARPYLYMDCLFLAESVRGRGIGQMLMDQVRDEARRLGCDQVRWQTPDFNAGAIRFYHRLGAVSTRKISFKWQMDGRKTDTRQVAKPSSTSVPLSSEPYRPRPTRLTCIGQCNGWQLKVYAITLDGEPFARHVVDAALAYAEANVAWPMEAVDRYGFLILHTGAASIWALVKVWTRDILHQSIFCAPLSAPTEFAPSPFPSFAACVWELEVTKHERDAWVRHVMSSPEQPKFDAYLSDGLTIEPSSNSSRLAESNTERP